MTNENKLPLSAKELRLLYGVCQTTWATWLKPIGIRRGAKVYTPNEQQKIVSHLGAP